MPNEATKAWKRRQLEVGWDIVLKGDGIDIGCGNDPITSDMYPRVKSVMGYDKSINNNHDAQTLKDLADNSFDFVHSSHCLEHMENPLLALTNWIRVLKPGGYLVCTIPDEELYEHGFWPSRFNGDHKVAFTLHKIPLIRHAIYVPGLLKCFGARIAISSLKRLEDNFNRDLSPNVDQTGFDNVECAIEFVIQKSILREDVLQ